MGWEVEEDYISTKDEVAAKLEQYQGMVIRSRFPVDKAFLASAKNLKFIARVGAGMENIDIPFAESMGIHLIKAPEGNRDAVGEHAIGMLLMLFNNLKRADAEVRDGLWKREANRGFEIHGKPEGTAMTVDFRLNGMKLIALTGGPKFKFNQSFSIVIYCDTQNEIHHYWSTLLLVGSVNH